MIIISMVPIIGYPKIPTVHHHSLFKSAMFSYVYIFMTIQWVYDFGQTHVFLQPICVNKVYFQYLVKLVGTIFKDQPGYMLSIMSHKFDFEFPCMHINFVPVFPTARDCVFSGYPGPSGPPSPPSPPTLIPKTR